MNRSRCLFATVIGLLCARARVPVCEFIVLTANTRVCQGVSVNIHSFVQPGVVYNILYAQTYTHLSICAYVSTAYVCECAFGYVDRRMTTVFINVRGVRASACENVCVEIFILLHG